MPSRSLRTGQPTMSKKYKYGYVIYFERDKPVESSLWIQWSYMKPLLISQVLEEAKIHRDARLRGWRVANVVPGWREQ